MGEVSALSLEGEEHRMHLKAVYVLVLVVAGGRFGESSLPVYRLCLRACKTCTLPIPLRFHAGSADLQISGSTVQ